MLGMRIRRHVFAGSLEKVPPRITSIGPRELVANLPYDRRTCSASLHNVLSCLSNISGRLPGLLVLHVAFIEIIHKMA